MNNLLLKTLVFLICGTSYYLYRLYKIPNCLFRINSNNKKELCLGSLYAGLIGPIKTIYLSFKYNELKSTCFIFKNLFLSKDNPIIIFLFFSFIFLI